MTRIVCDTNILVSAIRFGGNAREIVDLVSGGRVVGIVSIGICQELERVLLRPKFGLTAAQGGGYPRTRPGHLSSRHTPGVDPGRAA